MAVRTCACHWYANAGRVVATEQTTDIDVRILRPPSSSKSDARHATTATRIVRRTGCCPRITKLTTQLRNRRDHYGIVATRRTAQNRDTPNEDLCACAADIVASDRRRPRS